MSEFNTTAAGTETDPTPGPRKKALLALAARTEHTIDELVDFDEDELQALVDDLDVVDALPARVALLEEKIDGAEEKMDGALETGDGPSDGFAGQELEVGGYFQTQDTEGNGDSTESLGRFENNRDYDPDGVGAVGSPMGGRSGEDPVTGAAYAAAGTEGIDLRDLSEEAREEILAELATVTEFTIDGLRDLDVGTVENLLESLGDQIDLEELEARLDELQQQTGGDDVLVDGYFAGESTEERSTENEEDIEVGGYFTNTEPRS